MKNADRINFYIAGLRHPAGQPAATSGNRAQHAAGMPVTDGEAASGPAAGDRPTVSPTLPEILPQSPQDRPLGVQGKLPLTANGQQVAPPDQVQLHRLLLQLNSGRHRLDEQVAPSPEATRKRHRRLVLGLILAGCIIAAQATAAVWLYQRAELLLGRPLSPALLLAASADDLNVVFRPSADAGDVAVLLRELELRVVDGPNTASRYVLRPEAGTDGRHALNALRDRRDLVYSADPAF